MPTLAERLRDRIEREGPITARDFMEAALYDPEGGYYAKGPSIGERGDFYTAANVSLFPHALRRFVDAAVARLEGARVLELGGGAGELAAKMGRPVTVIEPSAGLAAAQRARGLDVVRALDELKPAPSVVLANEVLDALPAHRIVATESGLFEARVAWRDGAFVETSGELSPAVRDEARALALEPGQAAEVCLDAARLLADLAKAAPRCIVLFLDYGRDGPGDSLRGFCEHRVTSAYDAPGEQDVTADVDFSRVQRQALAQGYDIIGHTTQGELLADLGLVDDMTSAMARGDMQAYLAGKNLLLPGGMGERFRALCVSRDAAVKPPLPGFRKDIYPGASRR